MQIEVIKVDVESKGKYKQANVAYKGSDGKVQSRFLVSFGDYKHVYDKLTQATQGDLFEIKLEKVVGKDNVERWQWTGAEVVGKAGVGAAPSAAKAATASPRSSFETPEERAKRQVYIVRQSSISNAIELASLNNKKASVKDILETADQFVQYVFGNFVEPSKAQEDYNVEIL